MDLPHANNAPASDEQRAAEEQQKRQRMSLVALVAFMVFAFTFMGSTTPSAPVTTVARGKDLYDSVALKAGAGKSTNAFNMQASVSDVDTYASSPRGFRDEKKIVVLLTSGSDADACARSIIAARDLAFLSARVHFRVFEEISVVHDDSCLQVYCDLRPRDCKVMLRSKRLRVVRRDVSGARGASVALHLIEGMVEKKAFENDFYLSVDPNVVFSKHWDLEMLKQWYNIGNDMAILSVAPPAEETKGMNNGTYFLQCSARIHSKDKDAIVEFNPPEPKVISGTSDGVSAFLFASPVLQSQYSERFHFGRVSSLLHVRSDPHLAHLVVGHEYMRATRFWTMGYDFYSPTKDILHYRYEWPLAPHEKGKSDAAILRSSRRIRTMLGLAVSTTGETFDDAKLYGPGDRRTLQQWQEFSAIAPDAAFNESTTNHFVNCDTPRHYVHHGKVSSVGL